jgi:asparagine synthase (glutamine-hydrolysing)
MPWELPQLLDETFVREGLLQLQTLPNLERTVQGIDGDHGRVAALEMIWYMRNQLLRDTDWASMAHSVEIRVPLVDVEFLQKAAPLVASLGPALKQVMARTLAKALPDAVFTRHKSGFCVPTSEWLLGGASKGAGSREWGTEVYRGTVELRCAR